MRGGDGADGRYAAASIAVVAEWVYGGTAAAGPIVDTAVKLGLVRH
jgi:hypothetical protein